MPISAVRAALVGALVACSAMGVPSSAEAKKRRPIASLDATACPRFAQKNDKKAKSITFQLENRCGQPIQCTVSWEVSCPGGFGGERHSEPLELAAGAAQSLEASAATCGDGSWQISPAEWRCTFKQEGNTASR
jgi:hypothetical protein